MVVRILVLLAAVATAGSGVAAAPAATVNGVAIPYEDYIAVLETTSVKGPIGEQAAGAAALERLVSEYLVVQLAEKEGVPVTAEQIERRIKVAQKAGDFAEVLKRRNMTLEDFKREVRAQQAVVNLATKGTEITDGEIKDYYFKNKARFSQPARVKIAAIVAKDKEKIVTAAARLKAGAAFSDVARELSDDQVTRETGGTLGWVWPNQPGVPPAISNTALTLKVDGVSAPIQVQDQWVILKALEKKPPTSTPIEEVRDSIWEAIALERAGKNPELQKRLEDYRRGATIEIGVERFKDLAATLKARLGPEK